MLCRKNSLLKNSGISKKSSSTPLLRDAWQEDSPETAPQDLTPGSDPLAETSGITEEYASMRVTEANLDNPSPSTEYGDLKLGKSHQGIHSKSLQNPT